MDEFARFVSACPDMAKREVLDEAFGIFGSLYVEKRSLAFDQRVVDGRFLDEFYRFEFASNGFSCKLVERSAALDELETCELSDVATSHSKGRPLAKKLQLQPVSALFKFVAYTTT
jgi:hypothetical protein